MSTDQKRAVIWRHILAGHSTPLPDMDPQTWKEEELLIKGIQLTAEQLTRQRIAKAITSANRQQRTKNRRIVILSIAAAISLLVILIFNFQDTTNYHQLAIASYSVAPTTLLQKNNQFKSFDKNKEYYLKGIELYTKKEYNKSIVFFSKIDKENPNYEHARFLLANAYIINDEHKKAIRELETIYAANNTATIKWYLAIALAFDNNNKCLPLLNDLSKTKNLYQKEAKTLIKQITKIKNKKIL